MANPIDTWLHELIKALEHAALDPAAPSYDIEWLLLRCRDTLGFRDDWRDASVVQLTRSLKEFAEEHPGQVPIDLLTPPTTNRS